MKPICMAAAAAALMLAPSAFAQSPAPGAPATAAQNAPASGPANDPVSGANRTVKGSHSRGGAASDTGGQDSTYPAGARSSRVPLEATSEAARPSRSTSAAAPSPGGAAYDPGGSRATGTGRTEPPTGF